MSRTYTISPTRFDKCSLIQGNDNKKGFSCYKLSSTFP